MSATVSHTSEKKAIQAHLWARDPLDYYTEPSWISERLFAVEKFEGDIVDPACGSGRIVRAARAAGLHSFGTDIKKRCEECLVVRDFLGETGARYDNIVSNPPFKHAEAFIDLALKRTERKVAMILPAKFMSGDKRSRWLETTPLRRVLHITPRPSMPPGAVIEAGVSPGGGKEDFAVLIWLKGFDGKPETGWLRRQA
jgi:hypothetical protein